ncbi:hydrogenase HycP [Actinomadura nitritigenes]|uniref:Hydrogenase-4 component E n=1 Tax=Actinomadura nitritigenes TaxID=134602 RepID=A0ABS3QQK9_9ACTN|nr:hypothetical protein [Actinomadura nitritigenes]MBO2436256.1 hypothetical protein [Actinomadura nitritigenes]
MNHTLYVQLLDLACGAFLLAGVLVLWRRDLAAIVRLFALQGAALGALVAVLGFHEGDPQVIGLAAGIGLLRAVLLPWLLRRALAAGGASPGAAGGANRETEPLVNVAASLVVAALLALLAYAVTRPVVALDPSPAAHAVPVALTVVLIGFFALVTRRRALSQVVGFLLMDNGITAVAFLTTSGVPLIVEGGVSLDVLMAVLVLQLLTARIRAAFGDTDLDDLRELRD